MKRFPLLSRARETNDCNSPRSLRSFYRFVMTGLGPGPGRLMIVFGADKIYEMACGK